MSKLKKFNRPPKHMRDLIQRAKEFAEVAHGQQVRKYTGVPYVVHTQAVAAIVEKAGGDPAQVAAAHLHDVLEDTDIQVDEIVRVFGEDIANLVCALTDRFTKEDFPEQNRKERKAREAIRLGTISGRAQSVKYADIIDNGKDLAQNDPQFYRTYWREVSEALQGMTKGDPALRDQVYEVLKP